MSYGPVIIPVVGGIPPYTFEIIDGELPPNLSLNTSTGSISGEISADVRPGIWPFTVGVTDSSGPPQELKKTYTINIVEKVQIAEKDTLTTNLYARFEHQICTIGGFPPFIFTATGLPSWLFLTEMGFLYGTPPKVGTYPFTISINDSFCSGSTSRTISLIVEDTPEILKIDSPCLEPGKLFSIPLVAKGGKPPYYWTTPDINYQLPEYLIIDNLLGIISGIVYDEQEKISRIQVMDSNSKTDTLDIKFRIDKTCGRQKYIHSPLSDSVTVRNNFHQMNLYNLLPDIY